MLIKNTDHQFGIPSRFIHWGVVLLMLATFIIGERMDDMPEGPVLWNTIALHKSLGVGVMIMVFIRLFWWKAAGLPKPAPNQAGWQIMAAKLVKISLIGVMIALPVSGVVISQSGGHPVSFFGLFELPTLMGKVHWVHEAAEEVHESLVGIFWFLTFLHVAGALKHHFLDKDDTLRRMTSGRLKQTEAAE